MNSRGLVFVNGVGVERWASTYLYFLSGRALKVIGGRVLSEAVYEISPDVSNNSIHARSVSLPLLRTVNRYLLKPGMRSWYKASALTFENCRSMCLKAGTIFNEMYISGLAESTGVAFIDIFNGSWFLRRLRTAQHFLIELWLIRLSTWTRIRAGQSAGNE